MTYSAVSSCTTTKIKTNVTQTHVITHLLPSLLYRLDIKMGLQKAFGLNIGSCFLTSLFFAFIIIMSTIFLIVSFEFAFSPYIQHHLTITYYILVCSESFFCANRVFIIMCSFFMPFSLLSSLHVTELLHTGISCQNFFHTTIIPAWKVSWVSKEAKKLSLHPIIVCNSKVMLYIWGKSKFKADNQKDG